MSGNSINIDMERIDGYKFRAKFDKEGMGEIITDETEEVGGDGEGPNPSRLLATSALHCLMSSLIFCLNKKRVDIGAMKGEVEGKIERVDKRLRVTKLNVDIHPEVKEKDKQKLEQCVDIFEDYCVVTQSIRNGIDVEVNVEPEV